MQFACLSGASLVVAVFKWQEEDQRKQTYRNNVRKESSISSLTLKGHL